jgi:hypothetical protein
MIAVVRRSLNSTAHHENQLNTVGNMKDYVVRYRELEEVLRIRGSDAIVQFVHCFLIVVPGTIH